jgi:hypothetical protein
MELSCQSFKPDCFLELRHIGDSNVVDHTDGGAT